MGNSLIPQREQWPAVVGGQQADRLPEGGGPRLVESGVGGIARAVTIYLLQDKLRTGEKAVVRFRFLKHPEYLKVGAKLLFREGVTKGIGHVTDVQAITAEAQANMGF